MTKLYLVVPCYNEQEVLPETSKRLLLKINELIAAQKISKLSRILFVDDGSRDDTWSIISALHESNDIFSGVKLSRNKGHQNALLAGLSVSLQYKADAIVSLDADLQDDINAIDEMVDRYHEGFEVVYGVRSCRDSDTVFKRTSARLYYKLMKLLGVDLVFDHADYRLMSNQALKGLMEFNEVNMFLRGVVPLIGFKSTVVTYERGERFAGESKYPLKAMIAFGMEGVTSFSIRPIRFITLTGTLIFLISIIALIVILFQKLLGYTIEGWSTVMGSIWLLGGLQLLGIGIIGEYVGRVYQESKHRPRFILEEVKLKEN